MRALLNCVVIVGASAAWSAPEVLPAVAETMAELRKIEAAGYHPGAVDTLRLKYQDLVRARPGDAMPRVYVAWCTLPSDDAWNQLKGIAAIFPDNPWVRYGMGRIYTNWKGMTELAKGEFEAILKRDPKFFPALVGQGDIARQKEDFAVAEAKYQAALALADDPFAHAGLGLLYAAQQKSEEARAELRKAIAAQPEQPQALGVLVKLSLEARDPETVNAAQALADLRPKDPDARKMLADLRFEAGDTPAATKEYERLVRVGFPTVPVLERLAALYREASDAEGEERTLQTLASVADKDTKANLRLAELKLARKDLEGAEGQWLEVLSRDPKQVAAREAIARLRLASGPPYEALEQYRMALKIDPASAESLAAVQKLEDELKLPKKKAHGNVNNVYWAAQTSLGKFFEARRATNPGLTGTFKLRVRITAGGVASGVDVIEDTLHDPVLLSHAWVVLHDAEYPKQKVEPVFEFELGAKKKGK